MRKEEANVGAQRYDVFVRDMMGMGIVAWQCALVLQVSFVRSGV